MKWEGNRESDNVEDRRDGDDGGSGFGFGGRSIGLGSILESGDIEGALQAANAIGDDTLQRQSQGTVVPDSFTHGSSAQRVRWFKRGIEAGRLNNCNTFDAQQL